MISQLTRMSAAYFGHNKKKPVRVAVTGAAG